MDLIGREKRTVERMIRLWCHHAEGNHELCPACAGLLDYAFSRLDRCPYAECKPACKECATHCYKPAMRERIRIVMRYAGPRMILYHPGEAIKHIFGK
jgi:hypothetical protein